jgi:diguanylate cyclase (GGDEF)-like protein
MPDRGLQTRPPVVLIVDDQEWSTRSLESVLAPNGYAVMRAYTARKGIERALVQPPDLLFVSTNLPNGDSVSLCRTLRKSPNFGASVPILVTSPERPTREQRLAALEAGAWEFISYPIDAQELLLRLGAYVHAKFEVDSAQDRCLVDEPTGLYNLRGLEQRARELRSQAYREHQAMACVVVAPAQPSKENEQGDNGSDEAAIAAAGKLGRALRRMGRTSDAIGRLGKNEFAILAPSTNAAGAAKLAERIAEEIRNGADGDKSTGPDLSLHAGYDAVANMRETPIEARDLLLHATTALRQVKSKGNGDWMHAFERR